MNYPRPYMSITELVDFTGLSRCYFKDLSRAKGAPLLLTKSGGKIFFKTNELDTFIEEVNKKILAKR